MTASSWPAIALARTCDGLPRLPCVLTYPQGPVLGSVAIHHLGALREWPDAFELIAGWREEPYPLGDRGAAMGELTVDAALDFAVGQGLVEPVSGARESTAARLTTAQRLAFEALRPTKAVAFQGLDSWSTIQSI